jgi:hypothetical protein
MNHAHRTTAADLAALINDIAAGAKAAIIVTVTTPKGEELRRFAVTSTRHTETMLATRVRLFHLAPEPSVFIEVSDLPTQDDADRAAYHVEEEGVQHPGDHEDPR